MAGEQTTQLAEVVYLLKKLEGAVLPEGLKEKIDIKLKRLRRMARQGQLAGEYEATAKYIDWCLAVPWGKYTQDNLNLDSTKTIMDQMHYSHDNVKELVLEYLAILNRKTSTNDANYVSPVLAFVGVQGAGKTSLAQSIAKSLNRPFFRISLGAIGTSSELRGSPHEISSSDPGQIIKALSIAGCLNPVILLDEFDKVSGSEAARTDFMAIMLEILDPQQNQTFRDHYIDYPVDLSKILFIATANRFTTLSRELLDRLEIVQFPDYSMEEKMVIAVKYLFPQSLQYAGLTVQELQVTNEAWPILINAFAKDQGVRRLERNLQRMARRVIKKIITGQVKSVVIDARLAQEYAKYVLPSIESVRNIDYTKSGPSSV
ncbi:MAG: AAA family ATPase [Patescibacteria group bacterium]|nr:AAA family ATPase [Patescibacteria group bacterium]